GRRGVNGKFPGLEIGKLCIAALEPHAARRTAGELRRHAFVVKFDAPSKRIELRPTRLVVERQALECRACEKNPAAVAKRKMEQRTLQQHIRVRHASRHQSLLEPLERL